MNEQEQVRLDKLKAFPTAYQPQTDWISIEQFRDLYDRVELVAGAPAQGPAIQVMGRIRSIRGHGKLVFIDIQNDVESLQLMCSAETMGKEEQNRLQLLDLGDLVVGSGWRCRTKRGELSLKCSKVILDAKALVPIPEELVDPDVKQRQRYLDLIVNGMTNQRKRSEIIFTIRRIMNDLGFCEVETPMLSNIACGATARPFITMHNAWKEEFSLRISPELYLKQLVIGGMHQVFEIGKNFRNEGVSNRHNPEFTMLEAYAAGYGGVDVVSLCNSLIRNVARAIQNFELETALRNRRIAFREELIEEHLHVSTEGMSKEEIAKIFDSDVAHLIKHPTYVTGFSMAESPLARASSGNPEVADRYELYINGMEIANMYGEQNNPEAQAKAFEAQAAAGGMATDPAYVEALRYGLPTTGGLGIGIDRLVMCLLKQTNIRDTILFPTRRSIKD